MDTYPQRLAAAIIKKKSAILLGMDPRPALIPTDCYPSSEHSVECTAQAFYTFADRLMTALVDRVAAVKLQIAFYEALGVPGMLAYQKTLRRAKELGLLTIGDIKRGDIGTTAEAYAMGHLGGPGEGPFEADAVTLNPWLGRDSLEPFFDRCIHRGKGVYVLLHTSNAGAADLQHLKISGKAREKLFTRLGSLISEWQKILPTEGGSPLGVVAGATYPHQLKESLDLLPNTPFLVPGYGAQGATGKNLQDLMKSKQKIHLVNASRSLIFAYREKGTSLEEGAIQAADEMKQDLM